MKLIGIDYGRRRIGMAATDETGTFIRSLSTLDRKTCSNVSSAIHDIVRDENPDTLVFGLPLDKNDDQTAMSIEVKSFAAAIAELTQLPVEYVDESLTSVRAHGIIRMHRKKHRRQKGNIDRIAACLILETYLQEHSEKS